ncbi:MAG: hypothetical protein GEV10_26345 [Streptosporangiales bacterium]|nr:hypothetical protein [Streptosporangiales bacterium]
MATFDEAFLFLTPPGADPAEQGVRENDLARSVFVPVSTDDEAAATAARLASTGLDLVELYGFGPRAAAKVWQATGGEVPVGVVGIEDPEPVTVRAVITPSPGADPAVDRYVHEHAGHRMTIISVPDPQAVPETALRLVEEGVERIDLCGGLGLLPAAATLEAVAGRAVVGTVMFGFESLPAVAAYRERFEQALAG